MRGKPFRMFRDRTDILFGTLQARRGEIVLRSPRAPTRAAPRSLRRPSVLGAITLPAVPRPQTVKAAQLFICHFKKTQFGWCSQKRKIVPSREGCGAYATRAPQCYGEELTRVALNGILNELAEIRSIMEERYYIWWIYVKKIISIG